MGLWPMYLLSWCLLQKKCRRLLVKTVWEYNVGFLLFNQIRIYLGVLLITIWFGLFYFNMPFTSSSAYRGNRRFLTHVWVSWASEAFSMCQALDKELDDHWGVNAHRFYAQGAYSKITTGTSDSKKKFRCCKSSKETSYFTWPQISLREREKKMWDLKDDNQPGERKTGTANLGRGTSMCGDSVQRSILTKKPGSWERREHGCSETRAGSHARPCEA